MFSVQVYEQGSVFWVIRGQATTTSAALANPDTRVFARGFKLKNIEPTGGQSLYVQQGTATAVDGWRIGPGESETFNLPDPAMLAVITTAATANYQIGAVQ